jgi:predicted RNA-binding protein with PUA-like domain
LAAVKVEPGLKDMLLLRNTRLSVSPLTSAQFDRLMKLAGADAKRISK